MSPPAHRVYGYVRINILYVCIYIYMRSMHIYTYALFRHAYVCIPVGICEVLLPIGTAHVWALSIHITELLFRDVF